MKRLFLAGLVLSAILPAFGQEPGAEPVRQVPQLIAKVPERADFFGAWMRQDGTYRLVVAKDADGKVTASYFNPKSITVESAAFRDDEGFVVLTVVLRDEGYPGSTYQLSYDASYRILVGAYQMPQSGQSHQVYFTPVAK